MMRQVFTLLALVVVAFSCSPEPRSGSQTNWLAACDSSETCGDLECICGACTTPCQSDAACAELPGASCIASTDMGSIALCEGQAPPSGICLPRCDVSPCADGTSCVASVCVPAGSPTADVTIDPEALRQTLVGFGASIAYTDASIVAHPQSGPLYDALFTEAGLDVLRLRNRYADGGEEVLLPTSEIVAAASERLGRAPVLFMNSASPPTELKANGSLTCAGDPATCTLVSLPAGGFDYAAFASYWRSSLEAYANAGIFPDYLSIQSHPNWVPPLDAALEACRFLPEEGTTTVTVDGAAVDVAYPGYREALAEVQSAIADLPRAPQVAASETGITGVNEFLTPLGASTFDALAFHSYGVDPAAVDVAPLEAIRDLAGQLGRPVLQTEMIAEGPETAILIHYALTAAGASAYLQNDLVALAADVAPLALVLLTADNLELQATYYAFLHYAKRTDPGWARVEASSSSPELLSSAWLSPDQTALTVVLVNSGANALDAQLVLSENLGSRLGRSAVTRTVFDGLERAAVLGELPPDGVVRVPSRSIVTVARWSD
jgi:hypothetical protein